ncbi:Mitochondrial tRNAs modification protein [Neophaeococcomyces mojaviensis]|uniref:Mitochondrial tRNAs modification protein n=1 Tax=Neophaeococcomyces mojaviensis TaxID=3383035 RepID=A0ACC3A812_9EURO|nr:Mitochondrial tRNAs modification protein [Knufia sp. JES_112]
MLYAGTKLSRFARSNAPKLQCRSWWQQKCNLLTLAIETSCDDTAVAILEKSSTEPAHRSGNGDSVDKREAISARLLFNEKTTARNTGLGGIHPIEALESHQANLSKLVSKAVGFLPNADAGLENVRSKSRVIQHNDGTLKRLPDFVSVTRGPGMRSNLACGLNTAKGLSAAWQVPLVGVHHMQAHALTPRLVDALERGQRVEDYQISIPKAVNASSLVEASELKPEFPLLTLLVSGGHTMLLHSKGLVDHQILATTRDVAIGDALDKCGRMILPENIKSKMKDTAYAKYLSDFAFAAATQYDMWPVPMKRKDEINKPDNRFGWQVQAPLADTRDMAFSFTSIATSIERTFKVRAGPADSRMSVEERLLFARTALGIAFEHLASRTIIALENLRIARHNISTLVVSGGVAANDFLRYFLRAMLNVRGFEHVQLLFPPPWLCTDNAAMIAWCGVEMYEAGFQSGLDIGALRKWSMDPTAADGGILGVGGWMQPNMVF